MKSANVAQLQTALDSIRWFYHWCRTSRWNNSHPWGLQPKKLPHFLIFFVPGDLALNPEIRTWARFLYNAPNCQVSSSYI